ncbi:hypothetical protein GCM10022261_13700 [Brevibacterium daeguense]|uniref:CT398-like coiled coil hairpin domain-containing protein n=1 Tax=Brevibacterium daeguense TaxID=909936 RepID=A0ABP8EIP7_9MICO|nr:hypothetical protein [Brevibacterium daeguense]
MQLTDLEHRALLDWIDLSTQLRRVTNAAKQAELVERLRALAGEHKANAARIADLESERAARVERAAGLERDVAARGQAIIELEAKLNAGVGLTSRDLLALQRDIDTARATRSSKEDEQLELLGEIEELDAELARLREAGTELAAEGRRLQTERAARSAELDAEAAQLHSQRAAREGELPESLRARVAAREAAGEVGAAIVVQRSCGACGAELSGMAQSRLTSGGQGETVECEECEAVLVRP